VVWFRAGKIVHRRSLAQTPTSWTTRLSSALRDPEIEVKFLPCTLRERERMEVIGARDPSESALRDSEG
jgi:hypothetical protein